MNTKFEIAGIVRHVGDVESVGSKGFQKRLLVITDPADKYPQEIPLEATGDMMPRLDGLIVGDAVEASFYLGGRAWNDKWFLSAKLAFVKVTAKAAEVDPPVESGGEPEEGMAF